MNRSTVKGRPRQKGWSLWSEKRVPSEYEVVTHKLHYHFRREDSPFELSPTIPLAEWYRKYREASPFSVDDWEGFRDPYQLTYRGYIRLQHEREAYLNALIDEFESKDHCRHLSPGWVEVLDKLYIPSRFSGHILQMVAMYVGQMAPSSYITNAAYFQGADEMRHVQRSAYLAKALSLEHGAHLADSQRTQGIWEDDPHWQPLRETLERLLVAYDWGEAFTALNLVVKPVYDALFNEALGDLARANGDELLALMADEFANDSERSWGWSGALVKYALEKKPGLEELLHGWIQKWFPRAQAGAEGLASLFAQAPIGKGSEEVLSGIRARYASFLSDINLDGVVLD